MAPPASPMVGGTNLTDHSPEAGTTTGLPGCPLAALLDSEPAEQTASRDTARNATRPKDRNTPGTTYKPTHDRLTAIEPHGSEAAKLAAFACSAVVAAQRLCTDYGYGISSRLLSGCVRRVV